MKHSETEDLDLDDHIQYIHRNPASSARNIIQAGHYDMIPLTIKGALGHHEHLIDYKDFNGITLGYVDNDAGIHCPSLSTSSVSTGECETENLKAWSAKLDKLYAVDTKITAINGRDVERSHERQEAHNNDKGIHFTEASIDHSKIQNSGSRNHSEIDAHLGDSGIHFRQEHIKHGSIQGCGRNSHQAIDAHIDQGDVHYTQDQINHTKLQNLDQDTHPQYLLCNGHRPVKGLKVEKKLTANTIETEILQSSTSHSDALTAKVIGVDELGVTNDLKVGGDAVLGRVRTTDILCGDINAGSVDVKGDIRISGKVDGVYLGQLKKDFDDHINSTRKKDMHQTFNYRKKGLVPSPNKAVDDNTFLTSSGKWIPLRVYLELGIDGIICDEDTDWIVLKDKITIPYKGTYEISLHNLSSITLNGEEVAKSKNLGSHTFLLKLQQGDLITGMETSEVGSIYIKLLSYG